MVLMGAYADGEFSCGFANHQHDTLRVGMDLYMSPSPP